MPLWISFWHYFVSVTNSPVSAGELVFFSPSFLFWGEIFLSAQWGFCFSTAQFVFLPLCLCALVSFWRLYLRINQEYLYINEAESCLKVVIIWKRPDLVLSKQPIHSLNRPVVLRVKFDPFFKVPNT